MDYNKFCHIKALRNEGDVKEKFAIRLLHDLGYSDLDIKIESTERKGKKEKIPRPDYLAEIDETSLIVLEAKNPGDDVGKDEFIHDLRAYVALRTSEGKHVKFCLITSGHETKLFPPNLSKVIMNLRFENFTDDDPYYLELKWRVSKFRLLPDIKSSKEYIAMKCLEEIADLLDQGKIEPSPAFFACTKDRTTKKKVIHIEINLRKILEGVKKKECKAISYEELKGFIERYEGIEVIGDTVKCDITETNLSGMKKIAKVLGTIKRLPPKLEDRRAPWQKFVNYINELKRMGELPEDSWDIKDKELRIRWKEWWRCFTKYYYDKHKEQFEFKQRYIKKALSDAGILIKYGENAYCDGKLRWDVVHFNPEWWPEFVK